MPKNNKFCMRKMANYDMRLVVKNLISPKVALSSMKNFFVGKRDN